MFHVLPSVHVLVDITRAAHPTHTRISTVSRHLCRYNHHTIGQGAALTGYDVLVNPDFRARLG
jgi:hypothetical protein